MTFSFLLSALWLLLAAVLARRGWRGRRRVVLALLATGIPVLGLLTHSCGPVLGLVALGIGMAVMAMTQRPPRRRLDG
ncbi:hypothetical protein CG51_03015 [Haematobacter missouriensis]|uniref:DUF2484 domain-containing protein n=1 Tax=Haematobacter missouriensis TaxID=366616 RepID=A0A212ASW0_9RHOB|nr:DUF2484 family protein [Haematobacter missouriensis]KFI32313.1 hypothetical protein CG51_03015 [Haematobacter missouriensis]OWJ75239.1 hypothetical protein CDV53_10960 [Haematobacter missouriensis]OWJ84525.1 hypothetical protein CDV52_07520 [Haematobacter missouriensis]